MTIDISKLGRKPRKRPDVIHISGTVMVVENKARQRCAWCGCLLVDAPLEEANAGGMLRNLEDMIFEEGALILAHLNDDKTETFTQIESIQILPNNACPMIEKVARQRLEEHQKRNIVTNNNPIFGANGEIARKMHRGRN